MTHLLSLSRRDVLRLTSAGLASAAASRASWAQTAPAPLQIVGPWEIGGLSPANSGYVFTRLQVTETVMGANDDGTPAPGLARSWSTSGDGLTWRFVLRPGARFHDASPVTAAAVIRCLEAARTAPALLSQAPIESMEAADAHTVVIRLKTPFGGLPALLAHYSTMVLAPASLDATGRVVDIIGSGPYRVVTLSPPQRVETTAFEKFDGPGPQIRTVKYLAASRAETRALMAEGEQADLAYQLDPASVERLRQRPQVRIESVTLPRSVIVKLNAGLPALADVRVRHALSLAIDRPGIATALLRDPALAATQLFPPTLGTWHDSALAPLRFDPKEAARLLAEAGWQGGAGGLRNAQGEPLQLNLLTYPDRPELPTIAAALQEQWRQIGVSVKVDISNSGDIPLGHRNGSLQMGLASRNYATVPDPAGTLMQDFGPMGGDFGAMGWHDDALVSALESLSRGGLSSERGAQLRQQIAGILQSELPIIPVSWYRQQVAVSSRVSDVRLDPLERSYRITEMKWRSS